MEKLYFVTYETTVTVVADSEEKALQEADRRIDNEMTSGYGLDLDVKSIVAEKGE